MSSTQKPVAIVTGASSGIGLGITLTLLERGWRVVGASRTISSSKELTPSPDLVLVDGDVSKRETAIKVVGAALKHFSRIDLLVNNAGIYMPKAFTDYTEEDYNLEVSMPVGYNATATKPGSRLRELGLVLPKPGDRHRVRARRASERT